MAIILHRYKVLSAMLVLSEFTLEDIARITGVRLNTIASVKDRNAQFVEEIGVARNGKRGGQPLRYRVKTGEVAKLTGLLEQLYRELSIHKSSPTSSKDKDKAGAKELAAVEDLLVRHVGSFTDFRSREHLLDLAAVQIGVIDRAPWKADFSADFDKVTALYDFAVIEQTLSAGKPVAYATLWNVYRRASEKLESPEFRRIMNDRFEPLRNRCSHLTVTSVQENSRLASHLDILQRCGDEQNPIFTHLFLKCMREVLTYVTPDPIARVFEEGRLSVGLGPNLSD